jgi:hypothetical protein
MTRHERPRWEVDGSFLKGAGERPVNAPTVANEAVQQMKTKKPDFKNACNGHVYQKIMEQTRKLTIESICSRVSIEI